MRTLALAALLVATCGAPALAKPVAFDVLATYAPPGLTNASPTWADGHYHIGLAVGPRFGSKLAVIPVVNYLPKYTSSPGGRDTFRPGIMFGYAIAPHIDIAAGGIMRPVADHTYSLKAGTTPVAPVVGIALRL